MNCRFEVTLTSGKIVREHQANPKGHPANPMSDEELDGKFLSLAEPVLGSVRSRALLDALWRLDQLDDLGEVFCGARTWKR